MSDNVSALVTIDLRALEDVTGGTDWRRVWNATKQGAGDYSMGGTVMGAVAGSFVPGVGTLGGAGAGSVIGLGVGAVWGAGMELWRQSSEDSNKQWAPAPARR